VRKIFASWRIELIERKKEKGCFFCKYIAEDDDEKNLILKRGNLSFVIMNAYPYSNGHLMVAPNAHKGSLDQLTDEEMLEIFKLVRDSVNALKKTISPDGFNIGVNLGSEVSGAGVPDHLHFHIVPRWKGDHNFMPVIADTRVIPEALDSTYRKLKPNF